MHRLVELRFERGGWPPVFRTYVGGMERNFQFSPTNIPYGYSLVKIESFIIDDYENKIRAQYDSASLPILWGDGDELVLTFTTHVSPSMFDHAPGAKPKVNRDTIIGN